MRPTKAAAILFTLLFIPACASKFSGVRPGPPADQPRDCLQALYQIASACPPVKALLQFSFVGNDGKSRRTMGIIQTRPPGRWRIDLIGNIGGTIVEIRSIRDSVAVYLPPERVQARDRLGRLAALSDFGLPPTESLSVPMWFLAMPDSAWLAELGLLSSSLTESGCRLDFKGKDDTEHRIWFDPERSRINRYTLKWTGGQTTARYSNFRRVDGLVRPFRVEIRAPAGEEIQLDFKQITRPKTVNDDAFEPRSGPDIRPVDIEDIQWGYN